MKCNHCGQAFGDGITCQHCGCDRVEGLGSFNGYNTSQRSEIERGPESTSFVHPEGEEGHMLCFQCGEIIPLDSEFCPYCQVSQYEYCPNCGYRYPAKYPSCYKCGTNREQYNKRREQEKKEEEERRIAEAHRREEELLREKEEAEKRRKKEMQYRRIMKRKQGFVLREVCGEMMIIYEGFEANDFGKVVSLNDTAAWLWEQAGQQGEFCVYSLAYALCDVYEVSENTACADIDRLLSEWRELGIVE